MIETKSIRIDRICETCGNHFEATPSQVERRGAKYCSQKCYKGRPKKANLLSRSRRFGVDGYIYFVHAPQLNKIKIGFTKGSIEKRFKELQGQSPAVLKILAVISGTTLMEKQLHTQFSSARSHYEWFNETSEIWSFIDECISLKEVA